MWTLKELSEHVERLREAEGDDAGCVFMVVVASEVKDALAERDVTQEMLDKACCSDDGLLGWFDSKFDEATVFSETVDAVEEAINDDISFAEEMEREEWK